MVGLHEERLNSTIFQGIRHQTREQQCGREAPGTRWPAPSLAAFSFSPFDQCFFFAGGAGLTLFEPEPEPPPSAATSGCSCESTLFEFGDTSGRPSPSSFALAPFSACR